MLKIGHEVVRPGKRYGEADVTIPIPEELATTPGVPANQREVDWYAREYPLETMNITERASRDWANTIRDGHVEMREIRKEHDKLIVLLIGQAYRVRILVDSFLALILIVGVEGGDADF